MPPRPLPESVKDRLLAIPEATAAGEGLRDGQRVAIVFVEDIDRDAARIPQQVDGFEVIVKESDRPSFSSLTQQQTETTSRHRPVVGGVSSGVHYNDNRDSVTGTVGFVMTNGFVPVFVSNNHVYTATERAERGDPISQPGAIDGGNASTDRIGDLLSWVPFGEETTVDVGWSTVDIEVGFEQEIRGVGRYGWTPATVEEGDTVIGSGRTSGVKLTTVEATNVRVGPIETPGDQVGEVTFNDCIATEKWDDFGDSGAPVVLDDGEPYSPVGLHFAGSETTSFEIKIQNIMQEADLQFIGDQGIPNFRVAIEDLTVDRTAAALVYSVTNVGTTEETETVTIEVDVGQNGTVDGSREFDHTLPPGETTQNTALFDFPEFFEGRYADFCLTSSSSSGEICRTHSLGTSLTSQRLQEAGVFVGSVVALEVLFG